MKKSLIVVVGGVLLIAGIAFADDVTKLKALLSDIGAKTDEAFAMASRLNSSSSSGGDGESLIPLEINGRQWTFRTPPPKDLKIRKEHPRLLITKESIPEVKAKLGNLRLYGKELKSAYKQPALQALFYAVYGDVVAGEMAKKALLAVPEEGKMGYGTDGYGWCLVYDWCNDLFTPEERELALRKIMRTYGMEIPAPGSVDWKININRHNKKDNNFHGWYNNDTHEPRTHAKGVQLRGVIALAFHGDGVRDEWCEYAYQRMLDGGDYRIYPIYDAKRGGLLDLHNAMALDSGGCQAGNHGDPVTGYNSMFLNTCPMLMAAWESATGDELFSRDNFYRKLPNWLVYEVGVGERVGHMGAVQSCTGIYKLIDPEAASLAAWLDGKYGNGEFADLVTMMLGDKTVTPRSPVELGLPTSAYLEGADCCCSRSGWEDNATRVALTTRTIDTNRYEPDVGLLSISSRGEKLLCRGQAKKGSTNVLFGSGIWLWPRDAAIKPSQQSSTYWGGFHLRGRDEYVSRADNPFEVASKQGYRGVLPTENHGDAGHHIFGVDAARFAAYETSDLDVSKNKRTVVHLKPVGGREFVVVYDRVHVGNDVSQIWGGRFMNRPSVEGTQFTAVNKKMAIHGTVLAPTADLDVRGGPNKATEGPNGESFDGTGYIFKDDDSGRWMFGSYALFIKPQQLKERQNYCVVLEIGDAGFTPVPATMDGDVVSVGGWKVDFSKEDQTKVTR